MCKLPFRLPSGMFSGGWVAPGSSEKIRGHTRRLSSYLWDKHFSRSSFVSGGAEICRYPSMDLPTHIPLPIVLQFRSPSPAVYFMQPITEMRMQISIVIGQEAEMEKTNWVIL